MPKKMRERIELWEKNKVEPKTKAINTTSTKSEDCDRYRQKEIEMWNKELENPMYGRR